MAMGSRNPVILGKLLTRWSLLALAGVFGAPVGALAQGPLIIVDRAAWQAAAGGVTNIDFEGIAPAAGFTPFDTTAGLSRSGVNFVGISPSNARFRGATDLGVSRVNVAGLQAPVPNGTYYVRVRGENACGIGPASPERVVVVSFFPGQ